MQPSFDTLCKKAFTAIDSDIVAFDDEFIHGSPPRVAERIVEQCRTTGAGNLAACHPAALTYDELAHHYRLWQEVIPDAEVGRHRRTGGGLTGPRLSISRP
jgi:hypothetical protein